MPQPAFVEHCLELLQPLGQVRARRMFGGWGLWADDLFVAIILQERLYLKTVAQTQAAFAAAGCEPFSYGREGRQVALGFWSAPADALDSPQTMQTWARLALQAAVAARSQRSPARRRRLR